MTRRAEVLDTLVPHCVVEINPQEAEQYGVEDGEEVVVASRRGEITLKAKVTDRVMPGALFIPFHFHESPANILTIAALDPIAKIPEFKVCAVKLSKAE
jgi:predicted molibdopterin-dependent oxidoreductase YjgC